MSMSELAQQAKAFWTQLEAAGKLELPAAAQLLLPALLHNRSQSDTAVLLSEIRPKLDEKSWTAVQQAVAIDDLLSQLTRLFDTLRRQTEWALGIGEFLLLLDALQTKIGEKALTDVEALKELCQLLWAKSPIEQAILAHHFNQIISQPTLLATDQQPEEKLDIKPEETTKPDQPPEQESPLPKPEQPPAQEEPEPTPQPEPQDIVRETAEQMMDSAASRAFDTQDRELAYQRFLLTTDYLPVTRRQLKQSWRYLRRQVRQGPPAEIDVSATVRRITEDGFFLTPVLRPRRVNKAALLLLIDQNGSMVPFHVLSRRLEETVLSAGNLGQVAIYYFHDCPAAVRDGRLTNDLYREHIVTEHPQGLYGRPVSQILAEFDLDYTSVLIFSDAGAARSSWDEDRIEATHLFLVQLRSLGVKNIVWLNPMPEDRWDGDRLETLNLLDKFENSATAIAELVPMVSMERDGLYRAIDGLKGKA